jgi:hypothetical protein
LENTDVDGNSLSDEMTLTLINVPEAPEIPSGPDYVDVYKLQETNYTIQSVNEANDYFWELLPEEAGTLSFNDTTATINWNTDFLGEATLKVFASGDCGDGDFSEELIVFVDNTVGFNELDGNVQLTIAPNPNRGTFKIYLKTITEEPVDIIMVNYLGIEVFSMNNVMANQGFIKNVNNLNLSQGVYVMIIKQAGKRYSKKLLISK